MYRVGINQSFAAAALAATLTFGIAACGDDEPAAVVTPALPPPPQFQPQAIEVMLGGSGQSVTLMTTEAGGHTLDGEAFASGGTRAVTVNGIEISYTLTLADGSWSASCVCEIEVALGASGNTATVALNDADGTFSLGGEALASGDRRMGYVFALEGGSWTASFVPVSQTVDLGALGGTLELMQIEDGSWIIAPDGMALSTGSSVTVGGNSYVLTLGEDGIWTGAFSPDTMVLAGTDLTVRVREEGGYEIAGILLEFDEDGMDSVTLGTGERYLVTRNEDGTLQGARQEVRLESATADSFGNLDDEKPILANDDTHLAFDFDGTDADPQFSFADLLADGTAEASGSDLVAEAIAEIRGIRARAALLIGALDEDDDVESLQRVLGRNGLLGEIDTALDRVFGPDEANIVSDDDLERVPDPEDFLQEVDEILAALASAEALAASDNRDGVFQRGFDGDYEARNWEATAWLGSRGSVRFGVVEHISRDHANEGGANDPMRGSFRYATTVETGSLRPVRDRLELPGDALYDGETLAIDGEGTVYSGEIAVQVRLGASRVNGTIENLTAEDGSLWEPSFTVAGRGVETIILPAALLRRDAEWNFAGDPGDDSDDGFLSVSTRSGLNNRRIPIDFSFRGRLLGRGAAAGEEALGDWGTIVDVSAESTADWIRGSFGAELSGTDDVVLPDVADSGGAVGATISNIGPTGEAEDDPKGIDFGNGVLQLAELERANGDRWTLDLAAAFDSRGIVQTEDEQRYVDLARAELERLRDRLVVLHRAGGRDDEEDMTLVMAEANIWGDALDEVSRLLFGADDSDAEMPASRGMDIGATFPDTAASGRGYPSADGATARSDDAALAIIDELLEALESKSNYRDAYAEGGIFDNVYRDDGEDGITDSDSISRDPDGSDDFDRVRSRVTSLAGSTGLTRFGLFWGTEAASAVDEGVRSDLGDSEEEERFFVSEQYSDTGLYAYSELGPARYSERDPTLPRGGSATYGGDAVASYNRVLYTGTSELLVTWQQPRLEFVPDNTRGSRFRRARVIGRMRATFALERVDNGDRLVALVDDNPVDIDEIVFRNGLLELRDDGTIRSVLDPRLNQGIREGMPGGIIGPEVNLGVEFWNRSDARHTGAPLLSDDGTTRQNPRQVLDATFVGRTVDAPVGAIGYFKLQNANPNRQDVVRFTNLEEGRRAMDEAGSDDTEALVGVFGADLDPLSIVPASGTPSSDDLGGVLGFATIGNPVGAFGYGDDLSPRLLTQVMDEQVAVVLPGMLDSVLMVGEAPVRHTLLQGASEFARFGVAWTETMAPGAADYAPQGAVAFAYPWPAPQLPVGYYPLDRLDLEATRVGAIYEGGAAVLGVYDSTSPGDGIEYYTAEADAFMHFIAYDATGAFGDTSYRDALFAVALTNIARVDDDSPLMLFDSAGNRQEIGRITYNSVKVAFLADDNIRTATGSRVTTYGKAEINLRGPDMVDNFGSFSGFGPLLADNTAFEAVPADVLEPADASGVRRLSAGVFEKVNVEFFAGSNFNLPIGVLGHFNAKLESNQSVGSTELMGDSLVAGFASSSTNVVRRVPEILIGTP